MTNIKIMKNTTIRCPPKLDFDAPSHTESQFSLFQICSDCDQNWWPNTFEIDSCGCLREQKDRRGEVQKTQQKRHHKSSNICHKYAPKGGSPKVFFLCFLGSPSQDGLQGVPGQVPRPKSINRGPEMDLVYTFYCTPPTS